MEKVDARFRLENPSVWIPDFMKHRSSDESVYVVEQKSSEGGKQMRGRKQSKQELVRRSGRLVSEFMAQPSDQSSERLC